MSAVVIAALVIGAASAVSTRVATLRKAATVKVPVLTRSGEERLRRERQSA